MSRQKKKHCSPSAAHPKKKYCDYHNPDWVARFNNLKNYNYTTAIEGNTLYILHNNEHEYVYKKIIGNIYAKMNDKPKRPKAVAWFAMVNMQEQTLIEILESFSLLRRGDW